MEKRNILQTILVAMLIPFPETSYGMRRKTQTIRKYNEEKEILELIDSKTMATTKTIENCCAQYSKGQYLFYFTHEGKPEASDSHIVNLNDNTKKEIIIENCEAGRMYKQGEYIIAETNYINLNKGKYTRKFRLKYNLRIIDTKRWAECTKPIEHCNGNNINGQILYTWIDNGTDETDDIRFINLSTGQEIQNIKNCMISYNKDKFIGIEETYNNLGIKTYNSYNQVIKKYRLHIINKYTGKKILSLKRYKNYKIEPPYLQVTTTKGKIKQYNLNTQT